MQDEYERAIGDAKMLTTKSKDLLKEKRKLTKEVELLQENYERVK